TRPTATRLRAAPPDTAPSLPSRAKGARPRVERTVHRRPAFERGSNRTRSPQGVSEPESHRMIAAPDPARHAFASGQTLPTQPFQACPRRCLVPHTLRPPLRLREDPARPLRVVQRP